MRVDRTERRRLLRGQAPVGRGCGRGHARPGARPPGEMGRDPVGEHGGVAPRSWPGAVRGAGPQARRHDRGDALSDDRRRRSVRRLRRDPRAWPDQDHGAGRVPHSPRSPSTWRSSPPTPRRWARTAGRVAPRRPPSWSASSTWRPMSWASIPLELRRKNFIQPDEFPLTTVMGAELRQRRLRGRTQRGVAHRRLRRAAPRTGRTARAWRPPAARDRDVRAMSR